MISATARSLCRSSSPSAAATTHERRFWRRTLEELDQGAGDFDHAIQLLRKHAPCATRWTGRGTMAKLARDALGIFRDGPEKRALIEAVDFCIARGY